MNRVVELEARRDGDEVLLVAPGPGFFTEALPAGSLVAEGAPLGVLRVLGREWDLRAPAGARGRVVSERPERIEQPVGHGETLYRLAPLAADGDLTAAGLAAETASAEGLLVPSPQSGRFYHRPGPDDPPFAEVGSVLEPGRPIGLIEVMKTFAHVPYPAQGGLPQRARVVRLLAGDGAEVRRGDPLLEVEPA